MLISTVPRMFQLPQSAPFLFPVKTPLKTLSNVALATAILTCPIVSHADEPSLDSGEWRLPRLAKKGVASCDNPSSIRDAQRFLDLGSTPQLPDGSDWWKQHGCLSFTASIDRSDPLLLPKMRIDDTSESDGGAAVQISVPMWVADSKKIVWFTGWIAASEVAPDPIAAPSLADVQQNRAYVAQSTPVETAVKPQPKQSARFAVQLGAFSDRDAAQRWVTKLSAIGVAAYTEERTLADGTARTLLRAGPFPTEADARAAIAKIRTTGLAD